MAPRTQTRGARVDTSRKRFGLRIVKKIRGDRIFEDIIWYHSEMSREYAYNMSLENPKIIRLERLDKLPQEVREEEE